MVACGTSYRIPVYHMVQMDKWDCLTLDGGTWDIPWDPIVPYGTDGQVSPDGSKWDVLWKLRVPHGTDGIEVLPDS